MRATDSGRFLVDALPQLGLAFAAAYYQWARLWLGSDEPGSLVQFIHYPLLLVQTVNVALLVAAFDRSRFNEAV